MIFIVDFDGTIAPTDTVDALLGKFADAAWEGIERDWVAGRISSQDCMKNQLRLVSADREILDAFFHDIAIDPTFVSFVHGVEAFANVAVVSDGLDYPIRQAMSKIGMPSIPVFSNKLIFESNGLDISFPHSSDTCQPRSGVCKCAIARSFDNAPVILIGDGRSDHCLARSADYVFAKGSLQDFCRVEAIPFTFFNSFNDILTIVRRWGKTRFADTDRKRYAT